MPADPKNPVLNQFVYDASEFEEYSEDLAPGACLGMICAREGYEEARDEIVANQAVYGASAGIPDQEVDVLKTCDYRISRIDVFLPPLLKLVEVLTETRYKLDDQRQRIALNGASSVDRRSRKAPELLAKYQKTRAYRSAVAKKAMKTKKQKAAQEEQPAEEEQNEGGAESVKSAPESSPASASV